MLKNLVHTDTCSGVRKFNMVLLFYFSSNFVFLRYVFTSRLLMCLCALNVPSLCASAGPDAAAIIHAHSCNLYPHARHKHMSDAVGHDVLK
jgi:hypothetical protein